MGESMLKVICVNLNSGTGLSRTLASLAKQEFKDFSVLVQDGGSTDVSLEGIPSLYGLDIEVISEADTGIANAFNKALSRVIEPWVLFLNAGDELISDSVLRTVSSVLLESSADVVYGSFHVRQYDGEISVIDTDVEDMFRGLSRLNHQSSFLRTETHKRYFYDERLRVGMDYDLWLRMLRDECTFQKISIPISLFEVGGRSSALREAYDSLLWHEIILKINLRKSFSLWELILLIFRLLKKRVSYVIEKTIGVINWYKIRKAIRRR